LTLGVAAVGVGCLALTPRAAGADDHLLVSEAVLTPASSEYIEIFNPTSQTIQLDDYYLTDDASYAQLPAGTQSISFSDFIVRFPPGATIGPCQVIVVAFDGAGFTGDFAMTADFEITSADPGTPDMVATDVGSSPTLTNGGENATLFFWDGASDLVGDVDMVNLGVPSAANQIGNKTGVSVDGPDGDAVASPYVNDAGTMPLQASAPGSNLSTKRTQKEGTFEIQGGGNGITGHDETSEDIVNTWDTAFSAPSPGMIEPALADDFPSCSVPVVPSTWGKVKTRYE